MASCPTAQTSGHACAAVAATLAPRHAAEACQRIRHRDRGRSDSHGSDTADGARRCACVGGRGPQASRRVISALRVSTEAQPARSRPPTRKKSREFVPRTLSTRSNFTSCHDSYVATCCQRVRTSPAVTADRRSPCMARACRSAHKHGPRALRRLLLVAGQQGPIGAASAGTVGGARQLFGSSPLSIRLATHIAHLRSQNVPASAPWSEDGSRSMGLCRCSR